MDALGIMQMIQANNGSSQSGSFVENDEEFLVTTGQFLSNAEDVENWVAGVNKNMPVYSQTSSYNHRYPLPYENSLQLFFGYGKANESIQNSKIRISCCYHFC